ncbi:MAG: hypothetical protein CM15mP89_3230 [Gammaproteobacteria bacterium]|nr:MAG: hypothetical protein CM15mP89_3230 [Gammaproteobacteria bacterium]
MGRLAQLEQPVWLKNALIRAFMSRYEIDLTEATCSSAEDFPHFNAFFTRSLREGMRPLAASQWCHPADGVLSQRGAIAASELLQAKGRTYSVQQLLAGTAEEADRYAQGALRRPISRRGLSPGAHAHPRTSGQNTIRPGRSVFCQCCDSGQGRWLAGAQREIGLLFETERGGVAVVLVGAMIVAGIATVWGGREQPGGGEIRGRRGRLMRHHCWSRGRRWGAFSGFNGCVGDRGVRSALGECGRRCGHRSLCALPSTAISVQCGRSQSS